MESTRVKVNIFGQSYTVKGEASSEYILELADYLNKKMAEVSANISNGTSTQVAILAALNIADEYFQVRDLKSGSYLAIEEKTNKLIAMLDEGLIGDILSRIEAISIDNM
ncbi:MAG: cell division protein ZapA [Leptospirales bacterium]|nr:cell division protein ZapA [Leptospirales bacterium]